MIQQRAFNLLIMGQMMGPINTSAQFANSFYQSSCSVPRKFSSSDMKNCNKRPRAETPALPPDTSGGAPPLEGFPLPETIVLSEIFGRLELESLCTLACVCRNFRSTVSQALPTLTSLDLSVSFQSLKILLT